MPCGCKHKHKKGSGGTYLSGVTWQGYPKKGKGMVFRGTGAFRKRRRKKKGSGTTWADLKRNMDNQWARAPHGAGFRKRRRKKKSGGMTMTGGGMGVSGGGVNFSGGGMVNAAMRVVLNRFKNGRRVI